MDYKRNAQTTPAAAASAHAKNFIEELQKREMTLDLKDHHAINAAFRSLNKKKDLNNMSFDDLIRELNGLVPAVTAYVQRLQDSDFEEIAAPDSPVDVPAADGSGESGEESAAPDVKKEPEDEPKKNNKKDTKKRAGRPKASVTDKKTPEAEPVMSANPPISVLDMYSSYSGKKKAEARSKIYLLNRDKEFAHRAMTIYASDMAIMQAFVEPRSNQKGHKTLYGTELSTYKDIIHIMMQAFLEKLTNESKTESLAIVQKALEQEQERIEKIDEQIRKLQG